MDNREEYKNGYIKGYIWVAYEKGSADTPSMVREFSNRGWPTKELFTTSFGVGFRRGAKDAKNEKECKYSYGERPSYPIESIEESPKGGTFIDGYSDAQAIADSEGPLTREEAIEHLQYNEISLSSDYAIGFIRGSDDANLV